MDLILDCELIALAPRGHAAAVLVGPRRLSGDELAALLRQYVAQFTQVAPGSLLPLPAYWSPDGWQTANDIYVAAEGALSRRLVVDDAADQLTIDGCRVAGQALAAFTKPTPDGQWLRVVSTAAGVIVVESRNDLVQAPATHDTPAKAEAGTAAGPGGGDTPSPGNPSATPAGQGA